MPGAFSFVRVTHSLLPAYTVVNLRERGGSTLHDRQSWHRGGTGEYPTYDVDGNGRVLQPGHTHEVSWDALTNAAGVENGGASADVYGDVVQRSDVPEPDQALIEYRHVAGMERFSEREKDVVILTYVCLMWPREIAAFLGISVETVKKRLTRAKRKCPRK